MYSTCTIIKYCVNNSDAVCQISTQTGHERVECARIENTLQPIKEYVEKYAENYLIALHYLSFPIIIAMTKKRFEETDNFKIINEPIDFQKEITRILMNDQCEYIQGFNFLRKNVAIRKYILDSKDMYTFDIRAANSGLETYIINDLRITWKNTRYTYLMECLPETAEVLYRPNKAHRLYAYFMQYLKDIYKRGVDRFKTFICIGSSFIGKSVFFTKFIVPEQYYIYHSNNLEYSKMPDQPNKIFRILDDINWSGVSNTELKALMNRNISSVNIKYGYEYIFPLIPIIIMNKEDYKQFRTQYTDIWEFIERNAVIYPPQRSEICIQEEERLFTDELIEDIEQDYLFNEILDVHELKKYDGKNINEWIKNQLNSTKGYEYDMTRYIQIPENTMINIPNPEINKRKILDDYEKYILRKKEENMKNEGKEEEKKPWYKYNKMEGPKKTKKIISSSSSSSMSEDETSINTKNRRMNEDDTSDDDFNRSSSSLSDSDGSSNDNWGKPVIC